MWFLFVRIKKTLKKTCLTNGDLKHMVVLCLLKTMFSKKIFKDKKKKKKTHTHTHTLKRHIESTLFSLVL